MDEIKANPILHQQIADDMKNIYDIERISTKISYDTLNARDCVSLRRSLGALPYIIEKVSRFKSKLMTKIHGEFDDLGDIHDLLNKSISDNPPINIKDGGAIKDGYFDELDELRDISRNAKNT